MDLTLNKQKNQNLLINHNLSQRIKKILKKRKKLQQLKRQQELLEKQLHVKQLKKLKRNKGDKECLTKCSEDI